MAHPQDVARYVALHIELFGTYPGELMPRPDPDTMKLLQGTFNDFLLRNNITTIQPTLDLLLRSSGYK